MTIHGPGAMLDYTKEGFPNIRNQGHYEIKIRPAFRYMKVAGDTPESWGSVLARFTVAAIAYFPSGPMQFGWGMHNPKWQPSYRTHPMAWI
jgi:hypothetical protein